MLREWKLNLQMKIDRESHVAVFLQITHALIDEIRRGRLPAGSVLPGTRELASENGLNRKTVIKAYEELVAQGWLTSEGTKGTFVSATLPEVPSKPITRKLALSNTVLEGPQFRRLRPAPALTAVFGQPGLICLDDGVPDTRLFPIETFARAYRSGLSIAARQARLAYGDPRGSHSLRQAISSMLNVDRGLATTPDHICLTRGSQMAIYLTARVMLQPGDTVVTEDLSYPPAREAFRSAGANVVSVRLDENGLDVGHLEQVCRKHRVRLIYVTPHHQFPTTVLLPPDRRLRLMALSEQFGFALIEDDYDHEFHFVHKPLLPLASADPTKVLYIGSMSKLLAPSLRLGYVAAPPKVIDRLAAEILLLDRQGDPAMEYAVSELIDSGELRRHARKSLRVYAERRASAAAQLREGLDGWIDFRTPDGGLALWLTFRDEASLDRLEHNAPANKLRFISSRAFSAQPDGPRGLRLGFASLTAPELAHVVERLRAGIQG